MNHSFPVSLLRLLILSLSLVACQTEEVKKSRLTDEATAKIDFQKIATHADTIFWNATDRCIRENSSGLSQTVTVEDFEGRHDCEIIEVREVIDGDHRSFIAKVRLKDPKVPTTWFDLTYEEAGKGWDSIDAILVMDGHEMNYFEGRFLSLTNLKPYLDKATQDQLNKTPPTSGR